MTYDSSLKELLGNTPLALILGGSALFLCASGKVPYVSVEEPGWRIALAVLGLILVGLGTAFGWRVRRVNHTRSPSSTAEGESKVLFEPSPSAQLQPSSHATLLEARANVGSHDAFLQNVYRAVYQIYYQYYQEQPEIVAMEQDVVVTIDKSGNARTVDSRKYLVKKGSYSVDMFGVLGGSALHNYWSLELSAKSSGGRDVVFLPAYDSANEKKFLLFFLPPAQEGSVVDFSFQWTWPGAWERLARGVADSWSFSPKSSVLIRVLSVTFRIARELPRIEVRNIGQGGGELAISGQISKGGDFTEYMWNFGEIEPGMQCLLELKPHVTKLTKKETRDVEQS